MWAGVVTGKPALDGIARLKRKEKRHENINNRNPRRVGYHRRSTGIQSTPWSAKAGAGNGHAAANLRTACG
jgi:hypothetical protein